MTVPEILKELEPYTGQFPMEAVRAAVEHRDEIIPELLRVLESVAEDPITWGKREDYMLHIFAAFLLAQFREKRAYPLLVKIFSAPGEVPFDLFGDTVTEGLGQIFGSVYDGDPAPLERLVESDEVNEYVRSAAIEAFLVLEHTGQMPREQVVGYFQRLFTDRLKRTPSYAWSSLVSAVADMPALELLADVRRAYDEGLVDLAFATLESIERDISAPADDRRDRHYVITDAVTEMEWWASFHPEDSWPEESSEDASEDAAEIWPEDSVPFPGLKNPTTVAPASPSEDGYTVPTPFIREPKIGRNEPCPCGSGKKYKKCCGSG